MEVDKVFNLHAIFFSLEDRFLGMEDSRMVDL